MARRKIIIDTDPGIDDILAMLLAFSAKAEEVEVLLISVTFGNVAVESCLQNVVTLFHKIGDELEHRASSKRDLGFETLRKFKPIVAAGANEPLSAHSMRADHFHGIDGLGGISHTHPALSIKTTWSSLLAGEKADWLLFKPDPRTSVDIMLELLKHNPEDSITIVALGPLTTLALAAAKDPGTFLKVKEVVSMGGALNVPGNITPSAEFNIYADSVAAARVYALTARRPSLTMPSPESDPSGLGPYPTGLSRQLRLIQFPLDVTSQHNLYQKHFNTISTPQLQGKASPLAQWMKAFLDSTFGKLSTLVKPGEPLSLHDPLCIAYILENLPVLPDRQDIRVETAGQWTLGQTVCDTRRRQRPASPTRSPAGVSPQVEDLEGTSDDGGGWLGLYGNRVTVADVNTGWIDDIGEEIIRRILNEPHPTGLGPRKRV